MIEDPELPTVAQKYNHIFRCIRAKYKDASHDSHLFVLILPTICNSQHRCVWHMAHVMCAAWCDADNMVRLFCT